MFHPEAVYVLKDDGTLEEKTDVIVVDDTNEPDHRNFRLHCNDGQEMLSSDDDGIQFLETQPPGGNPGALHLQPGMRNNMIKEYDFSFIGAEVEVTTTSNSDFDIIERPPSPPILITNVWTKYPGPGKLYANNDHSEKDTSTDRLQHEKPKEKTNWFWDNLDSDDELLLNYKKRPNKKSRWLCALCYRWFEQKEALRDHMKTEHVPNSKFVECNICAKRFIARFLCIRHEKTHKSDMKHPLFMYLPKKKPYNCYVDNHFFEGYKGAKFTPGCFSEQEKVASDIQIETSTYPRTDCPKIFEEEQLLLEHYDAHHAHQTCPLCFSTFDNFSMMEEHMFKLHKMEAPKRRETGGAWAEWEEKYNIEQSALYALHYFHDYARPTEELPEDPVPSSPPELENANNSPIPKAKRRRKKPGQDSTKPKPERDDEEKEKLEETVETLPNEDNQDGESDPYPFKIKKVESVDPESYKEALAAQREKEPTTSQTDKDKEPWTPIGDEEENHSDMDLSDEFYPMIHSVNSQLVPPAPAPHCPFCNKLYPDKRDLARHVRTHTGQKLFICQFCGKTFATQCNKKEHERTHTGEKPYICPYCSKSFVKISNLKKHAITHKDQNLKCLKCDKQFSNLPTLILHQRAHAEDRRFRCHICDRAYNYASILKRHMRIHTGEMPYECDMCGTLFHDLGCLHYHRKKVHTGERPHKCEKCDRCFILSSDLKNHIRIHHSGDKPEGDRDRPAPPKVILVAQDAVKIPKERKCFLRKDQGGGRDGNPEPDLALDRLLDEQEALSRDDDDGIQFVETQSPGGTPGAMHLQPGLRIRRGLNFDLPQSANLLGLFSSIPNRSSNILTPQTQSFSNPVTYKITSAAQPPPPPQLVKKTKPIEELTLNDLLDDNVLMNFNDHLEKDTATDAITLYQQSPNSKNTNRRKSTGLPTLNESSELPPPESNPFCQMISGTPEKIKEPSESMEIEQGASYPPKEIHKCISFNTQKVKESKSFDLNEIGENIPQYFQQVFETSSVNEPEEALLKNNADLSNGYGHPMSMSVSHTEKKLNSPTDLFPLDLRIIKKS